MVLYTKSNTKDASDKEAKICAAGFTRETAENINCTSFFHTFRLLYALRRTFLIHRAL